MVWKGNVNNIEQVSTFTGKIIVLAWSHENDKSYRIISTSVMIKGVPLNISGSLVCCQHSSPNPKSNPLGTKVLAIARLAVNHSLPLTQGPARQPLVADVAGEAGLVPGLPRRPHQLSDEN